MNRLCFSPEEIIVHLKNSITILAVRLYASKWLLMSLLFVVCTFPSFAQENEKEENENILKDVPYESQFFKIRTNVVSDAFSPAEEQFFSMKMNGSAEYFPPYAGSQKSASLVSNLLNVKFTGPYNIGARTRAFLIDKSNTDVLFAGGTTGGVWKSTNQGTNWNPVNDQAENLNVTCIMQSPFDYNIIYYGTGEFIGNHTGVYGKGIFKSTDGGNTFNLLPATNITAFTFCQEIKHSLTDSNTVYVATSDSGVYRTIDAGISFNNVFSQYPKITDVECFPDGSVLIGVHKEGIFKSLTGDSGTFIQVTNGLPANGFTRIELAYCDSFPNIVYAAFGNDLAGFSSGLLGVYRSNDSGDNWVQVSNPDASFNYYFPRLNLCMMVKPNDSSFVLCGGADLAYTTDGGQTWGKVKNIHVDQHSIAFDPADLTRFYNGNDEGAGRHSIFTIDSLVENINNGYGVEQFYAGSYYPSGINFLAGSQDNHTQVCRNGDSLFTVIGDLGINGCFTQVNQQNPDISFASDNDGIIYRSDNSQDSLPNYYTVLNDLDANADNQVDDDVWQVNPFEINLKDGNQLYYVTKERVWRSTNAAMDWQPLINTVAKAPYALGLSNDTFPTLYIGGENGLFMRVDNAYSSVPGNEVDLSSSLPAAISADFISCLAVHPGNSAIVYAAFSNYSNQPRIWKISGANTLSPVFTDISGNLPGNLSVTWLEVDPLNPDSFLIAATDFGLYTTTDAGLTWSKELSIPNVSILNIRLRKSDRKLFIFTHGRGVWIADLASGGTIVYEAANENWITVFPNPFHNKININVSQAGMQISEIVINDIAGRNIRTIDCIGNSNSVGYLIDLSGEAKGVYFMNLIGENKTFYAKIVKN